MTTTTGSVESDGGVTCGLAARETPPGDLRPEVSVLIVSYNTADLLVHCLDSLAADVAGLAAEIIVVDNDSADDTVEQVRSRFPQVRLLAQEHNLGFARAANLAAENASGRHLLLLNPDTVVIPGAVRALLEFAVLNPHYGLYGGQTRRADGSIDPRSCWGAPTVWSTFCFATGLSTWRRRSRAFDPESLGRWQRDSVREVGVITGCLLLVLASKWQQLGGFDERYFMYGEDVDLSVRARALGWRPVITPDAVIVHHVGASSPTPVDKFIRVMAGKTTLVRSHWQGPRRAFGLGFLGAGVALRAAAGTALSKATRGRRGARVWPGVWRERRIWWPGYPPPTKHEP